MAFCRGGSSAELLSRVFLLVVHQPIERTDDSWQDDKFE